MNAETKWTPGPWRLHMNFSTRVCAGPKSSDGTDIADMDNMKRAVVSLEEREANARLIAAAPEMAEALQAEEEADRLFDAADEYTHRAEGEGWLNDPTGSLHVTEAWDRARQARERAKELRRAALSKTGG